MEASFNPWIQIWTEPRMTIRRILQESPERGFWVLAIIYGFSSLLNWFQSMALGQHLEVVHLFAIALLLSPIWGWIGFSVWSFVVAFTGKLLGGQGSYQEIRAAYAWSSVPLIVNVFLWGILGFVFGKTVFIQFSDETQVLSQGQIGLLFLIYILRIGTSIWSLVIYINALSEVRQFSVLRAIGNILLAALVLGIFFFLLINIGYSLMGASMPQNIVRPF